MQITRCRSVVFSVLAFFCSSQILTMIVVVNQESGKCELYDVVSCLLISFLFISLSFVSLSLVSSLFFEKERVNFGLGLIIDFQQFLRRW